MFDSISILGAGTMGVSIAVAAASKGYNVKLWNRKVPERVFKKLNQEILAFKKINGRLPSSDINAIAITSNLDEACRSPAIIESITEDFEEKSEFLKKVSSISCSNSFIFTNTSSLRIAELSKFVVHPERFAGTHFFNPVWKMRLVEIIFQDKNEEDFRNKSIEFIKSLGKEPVLSKDSPGFIVNRLLFAYLNNACCLLSDNISSAEQIDRAMNLGCNMPMGPFELLDFIGIDTSLSILERIYLETGNNVYKPSQILIDLKNLGHLGKKTGRGFYLYS